MMDWAVAASATYNLDMKCRNKATKVATSFVALADWQRLRNVDYRRSGLGLSGWRLRAGHL